MSATSSRATGRGFRPRGAHPHPRAPVRPHRVAGASCAEGGTPAKAASHAGRGGSARQALLEVREAFGLRVEEVVDPRPARCVVVEPVERGGSDVSQAQRDASGNTPSRSTVSSAVLWSCPSSTMPSRRASATSRYMANPSANQRGCRSSTNRLSCTFARGPFHFEDLHAQPIRVIEEEFLHLLVDRQAECVVFRSGEGNPVPPLDSHQDNQVQHLERTADTREPRFEVECITVLVSQQVGHEVHRTAVEQRVPRPLLQVGDRARELRFKILDRRGLREHMPLFFQLVVRLIDRDMGWQQVRQLLDERGLPSAMAPGNGDSHTRAL